MRRQTDRQTDSGVQVQICAAGEVRAQVFYSKGQTQPIQRNKETLRWRKKKMR